MKRFIKYHPIALTILLSLSYAVSNAQCLLTEEECRKVLILKNERDLFKDSYTLTEALYQETKKEVTYKDSTIQSLVVIAKNQREAIEILDDVKDSLQEDIVKKERAIRIRNTALRVGLPSAFLLGLVGGVYLTSVR
jgi:CRISPR/Cas system CMR subunit Cmr4 (Cas7 group RAMP superfamily)